jgi:glycosyltransferase involved in cell wall biosynthesis
MRMELVSVVIPNYNSEKTLAACIGALQAQTYPNIEIILADDGSTDGSVKVARDLGVTVVQQSKNAGSGVVRNLGAAQSRGDILFYVDSDVALAPDAVATAVSLLRADGSIGAICGVQDAEPLMNDTFVARYRGVQYHYWLRSAEGDTTILPSSICAIPVRVQEEIGAFNPALKQTEDFDLGFRISRRYRMLMTPAVHGKHAHDPSARILLRKLFQRGRLRIPLYLRIRTFSTGFETRERAWASLTAAASVPTLAASALTPWALLAGAALIGASIALDSGMYRFAAKLYGPGFVPRFAAMHYLVNLTIMTSVLAGGVQWLFSPRFRRLYDSPPPFVRTRKSAAAAPRDQRVLR